MLELTVIKTALLIVSATATLIWCMCHCTEVKTGTLLGATVFGFALMVAGFAQLRSIVMFL